VSNDGEKVAATVQAVPLKEADIFGFLKGTWSLAVNDKKWNRDFINVYRPAVSPDGRHVAAEVRLDICEYTIAVDGEPWAETFGCVWEPSFRNNESVLAPVRVGGNWTLAADGRVIWNGAYHQLWHQKFSPDGSRIAAVVSPSFGRWTIAVEDHPWEKTYGDAVLEPFFSPDGRHVAAIVKDNNRWTIAVDGEPWTETFDMVWSPVFGPTERDVIAKVENNGRFTIALNGKPWKRTFEALWEPAFSPDGTKVLVKAVEDEKYYRCVVPVQELLG
jgi:Tol biopolymer transport system component